MSDGLNRQLELLCRISEEDHSLSEIADLAYDLFDNPIHITDMSRTVLAHTSSIEIENDFWLRDVVADEGVQETPMQALEVRRIHNEPTRSRMPLYVIVFQEDSNNIESASLDIILEGLRQIPHSRVVIYKGRIVLVLSREKPVGN